MSAIELTISKGTTNVDVTVPAQTVDLTITGTSPKWGSINGTLSNQTDLLTALNAKLSLTGGTMTGALTVNNQITNLYSGALTIATQTTYAAHFSQVGSSSNGAVAIGSNNAANYIQSFGSRPLVFNSAGNNSFFYGSVGHGSAVFTPTHSITLGSNSTGYAHYNTSDTTTNYERARGFWSGSVYNLATEAGGTGTIRGIKLTTVNNFSLSVSNSSINGMVSVAGASGVSSAIGMLVNPTTTATSGRAYGLSIVPVVNQSSTAAYSALHINPTETAIGSGLNYLAHFQVGGVTKLIVNTNGSMQLPGSSSNTMTRPAISSSEVTGEINGYSSGNLTLDDGFLRLSAGGGTNPLTKSYIDLSGYSTDPDMLENIVMGTLGVERLRIKDNGLVEVPGGNGFALYNTADKLTNYERFRMFYSSNIFNITGEIGGTGTQRQLRIVAKGNQLDMSDTNAGFVFTRNATALDIVKFSSSSLTGSSGAQAMLSIGGTVTQSGTAAYYGIYMNMVESTTGSGVKRLLDLLVGGSSKFTVLNSGAITVASTATMAGISNTGTITSTGSTTLTGTTTLSGDINAGTGRNLTTSDATTAPNTLNVINQNVRGFSNSLAALAGQPDYFYNADRNPTYTATSNYGTVGNLFNGDLTSNLSAPVASLAATPLVIEIARTDGARINFTDVLTVIFTGHRLGSDGAVFTDYTVETKNSDGSYSVVLNRTGVSESVNLKSVPLHVLGDVYPDGTSTYHGVHGIRVTVSGAVASSFSAGNLQLNSIQLRDSRPQFTPAVGIGALDTRGGSIYGDISAPSTSGTKLGTTSTQKLGFWNATPIAQPTTSVASAAFVASAGTAVNDASTFDGYTIKQVVKALRNEGLLA